MREYGRRGLREARGEAARGGQALVVIDGAPAGRHVPTCFRRASEYGYLLDQDEERLVRTARGLGVRRVVVDRRGEPEQHVNLVGAPLAKAREHIKKEKTG